MPNIQARGAQAFLSAGYKEIKNPKTKKYRVFKKPDRPDILIYVGKKGALRVGKNINSSISIGKVR